jgi:ankyrin repeat protein
LEVDGVDVYKGTNEGMTPLHIVANNGHSLVVESLLQVDGVDVNKAANNRQRHEEQAGGVPREDSRVASLTDNVNDDLLVEAHGCFCLRRRFTRRS